MEGRALVVGQELAGKRKAERRWPRHSGTCGVVWGWLSSSVGIRGKGIQSGEGKVLGNYHLEGNVRHIALVLLALLGHTFSP
jgi:hypothetical protein